MPWTVQQKVFCVEKFVRTQSYRQTRTLFSSHFNCKLANTPSKPAIAKWIKKFREHGTINNLNAKNSATPTHSGRPKSTRTPENIAKVRESAVRSPKTSIRKRCQQLDLSRAGVHEILKKDLSLYPYHMAIVQKLETRE